MDVTIKNVPEGCEQFVRDMALEAIERFLRSRDVKASNAVIAKFHADMVTIRKANNKEEK